MDNMAMLSVSGGTLPNTNVWLPYEVYPSTTVDFNPTITAPTTVVDPMVEVFPEVRILPSPNGDVMFVPKDPERMIMKIMDEILAKANEYEEHERGRLIERPDEETEC
jgi:hypothetical protein